MNAPYFRSLLAGVAADWPAMLETAASGSGIGGERNPSRPPASIDVLSLRQEVTQWLASLCTLVIEERELDTRNLDGNDTPKMCGWLDNHAEWVVDHEAGESFGEELNDWFRQVHQVVDPREPKPDIVVASPLAVGGDLIRDRHTETLLRCTATGTTGTALDWYRARFPDIDRDVTIAELAALDGVTEQRVRDRLRNHRMTARNAGQRPALYDLAEWQWRKALKAGVTRQQATLTNDISVV